MIADGRDTCDIALIGPAHPIKGGIAQHTTELAHQLDADGHRARIESWAAQYPARLYPGEQNVAGDEELPSFGSTRRTLRWWDPLSWWRVGRRSRDVDRIVVTLVTSVQIIPYHVLLLAAGRRRPPIVALCHNVLPHEPRRPDVALVRSFLRRCDRVLTHSEAEADEARRLAPGRPVRTASIPPHLPTQATASAVGRPATGRLLFFGLVRPYKGLDDLLDAMTRVEGVELTIAGEVWGGTEALERRIADLGLGDRVHLLPGYVDAADLPALFAEHDALVLPYRDGTASQNVLLANRLGLPVIATNVGSFPSQIEDGVTGRLVEPFDPSSLASALAEIMEPDRLEHYRAGVAALPDPSALWPGYIATLLESEPPAVGSSPARLDPQE